MSKASLICCRSTLRGAVLFACNSRRCHARGRPAPADTNAEHQLIEPAWLSSAGIRAPTPRPRRSLSCENKLRPPVPVGASTRSAVSAGMPRQRGQLKVNPRRLCRGLINRPATACPHARHTLRRSTPDMMMTPLTIPGNTFGPSEGINTHTACPHSFSRASVLLCNLITALALSSRLRPDPSGRALQMFTCDLTANRN